MPHTTLICAEDARRIAGDAVWLDCRFDLVEPDAGSRAFAQGHVPGAFYLHLDHDLAGPKIGADGRFRGRHPLPDRAAFAARIGQLGIQPGTQVIAYDAQGGVMASRAWWLLRWLGHAEVAVLDGGLAAWTDAGGALDATPTSAPGGASYPASAEPAMPIIDADTLQRDLARVRIVDARAAERFRGDVEPLDAVAGHIPGATLRFFKDNLGADGRFKPAATLRDEWALLMATDGTTPIVQQCGSGVTACHNLLAMAHAGLGDTVLYPGSWSEWSSDPSRPVAQGD